MPVANLAQPLEIAGWRDQHAGRARHRLDNHRRDRFGAMQIDEPLEVVGQFGAVRRETAREGIAGQIVRVPQMIGSGQPRPCAAIADDPADADSAETDAMIAALAADQPGARPLPLRALHRECDLERGIDRFGPAVGKEYPVEPFGHQRRETLRQLEGQRMTQLKRRREIERCRRFGDGFCNFGAAVAGIAAPQARGAVENPAPVARLIIHPARRDELARMGLVGTVRGEGHPEARQLVVVTLHRSSPCFAEGGKRPLFCQPQSSPKVSLARSPCLASAQPTRQVSCDAIASKQSRTAKNRGGMATLGWEAYHRPHARWICVQTNKSSSFCSVCLRAEPLVYYPALNSLKAQY